MMNHLHFEGWERMKFPESYRLFGAAELMGDAFVEMRRAVERAGRASTAAAVAEMASVERAADAIVHAALIIESLADYHHVEALIARLKNGASAG